MSVFWPRLCCSLALAMSRQEKLLAAQAKIIQLQDELLTRQKEGHAGAPKAAPARIGDSAAHL